MGRATRDRRTVGHARSLGSRRIRHLDSRRATNLSSKTSAALLKKRELLVHRTLGGPPFLLTGPSDWSGTSFGTVDLDLVFTQEGPLNTFNLMNGIDPRARSGRT